MKYSRSDKRFPFTYAYDWLRMAGVANSRADAAEWVRSVTNSPLERDVLIERAAGEYIDYGNKIQQADDTKDSQFGHYAALALTLNT